MVEIAWRTLKAFTWKSLCRTFLATGIDAQCKMMRVLSVDVLSVSSVIKSGPNPAPSATNSFQSRVNLSAFNYRWLETRYRTTSATSSMWLTKGSCEFRPKLFEIAFWRLKRQNFSRYTRSRFYGLPVHVHHGKNWSDIIMKQTLQNTPLHAEGVAPNSALPAHSNNAPDTDYSSRLCHALFGARLCARIEHVCPWIAKGTTLRR